MEPHSPSNTRGKILSHIQAHPGVHFNELTRNLDMATGQVQYHIHRLLRQDRIIANALYGRTHYYPPEYSEWEQGVLALARRETSREIVFYLLDAGKSTPSSVSSELSIARSTLEWHLTRLIEQDVVVKHRNEDGTVRIALSDPNQLITLLSAVTPRVHDQLTDRFMRFVDSLFEP